MLYALGYYGGQLDMNCGPATEKAIRAFQKKKKLTVDGVCGPATFKKLLGV